MAILAASALLLSIRVLQDLLCGGRTSMMVSLLVAVFRRVAAVQDEIVEVAGAADTVHFFVLVRRRARSAD